MSAFMAFLLLETWFGSCLFDQIASNGSALKTFYQCAFKTFSVGRLRIMERSTVRSKDTVGGGPCMYFN